MPMPRRRFRRFIKAPPGSYAIRPCRYSRQGRMAYGRQRPFLNRRRHSARTAACPGRRAGNASVENRPETPSAASGIRREPVRQSVSRSGACTGSRPPRRTARTSGGKPPAALSAKNRFGQKFVRIISRMRGLASSVSPTSSRSRSSSSFIARTTSAYRGSP